MFREPLFAMRLYLFCCCGALSTLASLFPGALWAQQAQLTGVVVDAATAQPVPFAVVEMRSQRVGVQSTEQGTFTLDLPSALVATDSLRVSSLGYAPRVLAVPTASPCRLALQAVAVALPEAVVRASHAPLVRLGPVADASKFGFGGGAKLNAEHSEGWQIARGFVAPAAGSVRAVRFFVKPSPSCGKATVRTPFRVRLYAADGPGGSPGRDLLPTSVLAAASMAGWLEVDLTAYRVLAPAEGFFVAMEWLYTKPEFGCEYSYHAANKEKKTTRSYGQHLGGYLDAEAPTSWYLSAGYPWQPLRAIPPFEDRGHQQAAIQAIVQPD